MSSGHSAMEPSARSHAKKRLIILTPEIKSMLGPCMISFSIPLFIPGLTITLVAFNDETGFSKYGVLHVIGIVILSIACVLLVVGCVMRCACKSQVYPLLEVPPHHKVTTHEKPKQLLGRTLTKDRLPPLNHGPQPGGSSVLRDNGHVKDILPNPHRIIDSEISESDSEDMTSSASEEEGISSPLKKNNLNGLPANNFMNGPTHDNNDRRMKRKLSSVENDSEYSDRRDSSSVHNGTADSQSTKTTLLLENEIDSRKASLMCPSFTDMHQGDAENATSGVTNGDISDNPKADRRDVDEIDDEEEVVPVKPISGWVSRQSHDKLSRGSKISSETPSSYESSDAVEDRDAVEDDEGDDVTLTSRNCSTVPEIADLERDDSVEVDRFNNVWRGESQNSVEISSVVSQDEYSEESLSVVSKDQLEITEPTGSRGGASSDSALESGGNNSRALSQRYPDRIEVNSGLIEENFEESREHTA